MRSLRSILLAAVTLPLPLSLSADPQPLRAEIVEESFDPVWPVSGHVVVGVMGLLGQHPQPSIMLFVGPNVAIQICAEITSRSRNYRARVAISEVALPRAGGVVEVFKLTQDPDALSRLAGPDLAVRATQGNCGAPDEPPDPGEGPGAPRLFIAGWGDQDVFSGPGGAPLPDEIRLLVNARTSSAAVIATGREIELQSAPCAREDDPRRSGFDFVCTISLVAAKEKGLSELHVTIHRANFGQPEQAVPVVLRLYAKDDERTVQPGPER